MRVNVKVRVITCCVDGLSNNGPQVRMRVRVRATVLVEGYGEIRVITCCVDGLSNSWPQIRMRVRF